MHEAASRGTEQYRTFEWVLLDLPLVAARGRLTFFRRRSRGALSFAACGRS